MLSHMKYRSVECGSKYKHYYVVRVNANGKRFIVGIPSKTQLNIKKSCYCYFFLLLSFCHSKMINFQIIGKKTTIHDSNPMQWQWTDGDGILPEIEWFNLDGTHFFWLFSLLLFCSRFSVHLCTCSEYQLHNNDQTFSTTNTDFFNNRKITSNVLRKKIVLNSY